MKISPTSFKLRTSHLCLILGLALGGGALSFFAFNQSAVAGSSHGKEHADKDHAGHDHDEEADHDKKTGSHGGTLLQAGALSLEVKLEEDGQRAWLRVWPMQNGKALSSQGLRLQAKVKGLSGWQQDLSFSVDKDSLRSRESLSAPHAFTLHMQATVGGKDYSFNWRQDEGVLALSEEQIKAAGLSLETAAAASFADSLQLPAEVRLNEDRTAHVLPKIAGVVESVAVSLGQHVQKGQILATLSSPAAAEQRSEWQNAKQRLALAETTYVREKKLWEQQISAQQDYLQAQRAWQEARIAVTNAEQKLAALGLHGKAGSLNQVVLRAPQAGIVIEKHLTLGEAVKEDSAVLTISDLSQVWVEMNVPARDLPLAQAGTTVRIKAEGQTESGEGKIALLSDVVGAQTRMAKARVVLANPERQWRPGLMVNAQLLGKVQKVPLAVASSALHQLDNQSVVFVKVDGGFLAQPVSAGRSLDGRTEILQGISPGTVYAANGSFVLKSEAGKANASHSH